MKEFKPPTGNSPENPRERRRAEDVSRGLEQAAEALEKVDSGKLSPEQKRILKMKNQLLTGVAFVVAGYLVRDFGSFMTADIFEVIQKEEYVSLEHKIERMIALATVGTGVSLMLVGALRFLKGLRQLGKASES